MSEFKEVWFVWDGKNRPESSIVDAVIAKDGQLSRVDRRDDDEHFKNEFLWIDWPNIAAYTLGQKRRSVGCGVCKDSRFKGLIYCGGYFEYRKCPHCNGKGYRLERVE